MSELTYANQYFSKALETIKTVQQEESTSISKAAELCFDSIQQEGMIHMFGAGHSHLFAEEMSYRAGGLVYVNPIQDIGYTLYGGNYSRSTLLERLEGYATTILDSYELRPNEVMIISSQSGRNMGPVEAALYAKNKQLKVVAITSMEQSKNTESRHPSGKKLFELADVVIDNHVPAGDAAIELKTGAPKVAPLSTVVGATILQSLTAEIAGRILDATGKVPVWVSANVDDGDQNNIDVISNIPSRIKLFSL
ncbi:MAG: SIS domain-containing protein [Anaerolineaceae bacterium]|nr:SIS domain-containing protein [Anaerolineaceae bacterium]